MDPHESLDALVEPLRSDVVSGAAMVARRAAEVMRRSAVRLRAGSPEELRWGLGEVVERVLDAQPAMAPLVTLVADVLAAVARADGLEDARRAAASAAEAFRSGLEARTAAVADHGARILPETGSVGTVSSSSSVGAALAHWAPDPGRSVLCFESRPMNEGRKLAASLAGRGLDVRYAVDAAVDSLASSCAIVLLGADSIGDRGVVNKIGSASLARAAHAADVPVYVLSDSTKILPPGFPQVVDDERPASEVWEAPDGVRVWNRYFEVVSLDLVAGVVTESGVVTPTELEETRAAVAFPEELRRWAARRR